MEVVASKSTGVAIKTRSDHSVYMEPILSSSSIAKLGTIRDMFPDMWSDV
jgi:hypothetical protein